jgi:ATP-binding cassette, subfamily F, member 3
VIVSHDRYFISQTVNKIVEIRDGQLHLYRGDYHYYLEKIAQEKELKALTALEKEKEAKVAAKRDKQKEKEKARKVS